MSAPGKSGGHELESSEYIAPSFSERFYRMEMKADQLHEKISTLTPLASTVTKLEVGIERLEETITRTLDRLEQISKRVDETNNKLNATVTDLAIVQTKLMTEADKLEKLDKEVKDTSKFWGRWGVNILVGAVVAAITSYLFRR